MKQPTTLGNAFLENLADQISLPESVYERATNHYEAVGRWLEGTGSALEPYRPTIYPQGSIALGTAIRPPSGEEHDVDAVCVLKYPPSTISQQQLKRIVGDRLKEHQRYRDMLDPSTGGRRCWTLKYRESPAFHLDVLPAIPDSPQWLIESGVPLDWARTAICITDKTTWTPGGPWPRSNPKGFLAWFRHCMREQLREAKMDLQARTRADKGILMEMEEIPDYRVRTPLQSAVQILKHHRDRHCEGDPHKPISIIISTLAARSYGSEKTISETLLAIVPKMRDSIEKTNGTFRVGNPVDPRENFADKWAEESAKAETFFEWLDAIEKVVGSLAMSSSTAALKDAAARGFSHRYGHSALNETLRGVGIGGSASGVAAASVLVPPRSSAATRPRVELPERPIRHWQSR